LSFTYVLIAKARRRVGLFEGRFVVTQAYENFATLDGPALTLDETDNANAEELDAQTIADDAQSGINRNNRAVDAYQDQESTDYDGQQRAQSLALGNYQTADANGHAVAIAAYASANPSPWADEAAALAAAQATQQIAQALAQQTLTNAQAEAQMVQEQAQNDAEEAKDNALALAEHDQAVSDAEAKQGQDLAQAAADAVFESLPDTLIAPTDGAAFYLTNDLVVRNYEATDFTLPQTIAPGSTQGDVDAGWNQPYLGTPNFMPSDLGITDVVYDWTGYGHNMPWGLLGPAQFWATSNTGADSIIQGEPPPVANSAGLLPRPDEFRAFKQPDWTDVSQTYAGPPMQTPATLVAVDQRSPHYNDNEQGLLDPSNVPSNIKGGGYSQSSAATAPGASLLTVAGATTRTLSTLDSPSAAPFQLLSDPADGPDPKEPAARLDRAGRAPAAPIVAQLENPATAAIELEDVEKQVEAATLDDLLTDPLEGFSRDELMQELPKGVVLPRGVLSDKAFVVEFGGNEHPGKGKPLANDGGLTGFSALNEKITAAVVAKGGNAGDVQMNFVHYRGTLSMGLHNDVEGVQSPWCAGLSGVSLAFRG